MSCKIHDFEDNWGIKYEYLNSVYILARHILVFWKYEKVRRVIIIIYSKYIMPLIDFY